MKHCPGALISLILILFVSNYGIAETVFTHRTPESSADIRPNYEVSVLRLALEKTVQEYGPFRLEGTPLINVTRAVHSIRANSFPNFFYSLGYEETYQAYPEMTYVRFPIDLGVLGYRTCFTNDASVEKLSKITTLEALKKIPHGTGRGWADAKILRHNGFTVIEVDQYEKLFKMTAAGRFDLFCRGANEIKEEYDIRNTIPGLAYDRHILISYPMPILLYTNKQNVLAIERVTKGIQIAYADGSLQDLWSKQHQISVDFAGLAKRRVFQLENPLIKSIDFNHQQYNYDFAGSEKVQH